MYTLSSTASLIRFSTQTIHPRSRTSAINPKPHVPPSEVCDLEPRKNSKNHLVTNNNLKLSFSVILGRSDLISFRRAARKARNYKKASNKRLVNCVADSRLKQPVNTSLANLLKTPLASIPKLSSSIVPNSSTLFALVDFDFFLKSRIDPDDCVKAAWRCNINACEEDGVDAGSGGTSPKRSSVGAGAGFLLGLSFTDIVVPKRECREEALRAISRLFFSSVWRRRWRFSVGCFKVNQYWNGITMEAFTPLFDRWSDLQV